MRGFNLLLNYPMAMNTIVAYNDNVEEEIPN